MTNKNQYANYRNYLTYGHRYACANSVDPDQTPQNAASDQGLHCFPLIQQFDTLQYIAKRACFNFRTNMVSRLGVPILRIYTIVH